MPTTMSPSLFRRRLGRACPHGDDRGRRLPAASRGHLAGRSEQAAANYYAMRIDATSGVVVSMTHYDGFLGGGWATARPARPTTRSPDRVHNQVTTPADRSAGCFATEANSMHTNMATRETSSRKYRESRHRMEHHGNAALFKAEKAWASCIDHWRQVSRHSQR